MPVVIAELEGVSQAKKELSKVARDISSGVIDGDDLDDYGKRIRDKARENLIRRTGRNSRGRLARSLDYNVASANRLDIFSNVWYGEYVERKTGPARTRGRKMPMWSQSKPSYSSSGGQIEAFTTERKGYRGYRFMRDAMRWAASKLGDYIVRDVRDHLARS